MKYWRGYLVAAIIAACSWGLVQFAQSHWALVDMVYPYVSRLIQNFMADWSAGVSYCVWQMGILVLIAGVLASVVMMILWKWNVIQWLGWVLAVVSVVLLLNTGLYGLNAYAGPLAADIRLDVTDYTVSELQDAARFYQGKANDLAKKVGRDSQGQPEFAEFSQLAEQAADGFETLTYDRFYSIFAGTTVPVKELGWSDRFTRKGITGIHCGITGEAAVNTQTPDVGLPFAICRQMAMRVCIANKQDASFAAFLACTANTSAEFQYSGYFMAYRYCYDALNTMQIKSAQAAAASLKKNENSYLAADVERYNASFAVGSDYAYAEASEPAADGEDTQNTPVRSSVADLLTSWHIQQYVLPLMEEEEVMFDPMDENQVDLSGIVNAK